MCYHFRGYKFFHLNSFAASSLLFSPLGLIGIKIDPNLLNIKVEKLLKTCDRENTSYVITFVGNKPFKLFLIVQ